MREITINAPTKPKNSISLGKKDKAALRERSRQVKQQLYECSPNLNQTPQSITLIQSEQAFLFGTTQTLFENQ